MSAVPFFQSMAVNFLNAKYVTSHDIATPAKQTIDITVKGQKVMR
jgi:hypothetical protein